MTDRAEIVKSIVKLKQQIIKAPKELDFFGIIENKEIYDSLSSFFVDHVIYEDHTSLYYRGREAIVIHFIGGDKIENHKALIEKIKKVGGMQ